MTLRSLLFRLTLGSRQPIVDGEIAVPGLGSAITIRRDRWGIPHLEAESATDAAFALGFCQAQDRGFQLETHLRLGRGTLSELVGTASLPLDRMSRRIGFHRAAVKQLPVLEPVVASQISAFAAGISAGFAHGIREKPHEFSLVGGQPTPWEPTDVLAYLKLLSFMLPSNWDVELARLRILHADGAEAVRELDPLFPDWHPITTGGTVEFSQLLDRLAADLAAFQQMAPRGGGSNNWAVSGSRTISGKPLLASDPHLAPTLPAPWYLAHVRTPEHAVAGAMFAGAPAFPIGHNGFACWGVTAGLTDNTDLFIETLGPDGKSVRESDGSFTPCEVVRETIRIKGQPDVVEEILVTPRGPVISPLISEIPEVISLRAVWLEAMPVSGFVGAVTGKDFESFRKPFAAWPLLPLNLVYADSTGTIGWQLVGQVPVRKGGNGMVPRRADLPDSGWEGYVPFEQMPRLVNPPEGFLATANNLPQDPTLPPFLGFDFVDGYRVSVIREELGKHPVGWTVADFQKLQRNTRSKPWEEIRDIVLSLEPATDLARRGLELLRAWDGEVAANSPAAAVFELFLAEMSVRVAKAKAPKSWEVVLGESKFGPVLHSLFADRRVGHLVRLVRSKPDRWFPHGWDSEMLEALALVVQNLMRTRGPGPDWWTWGDARQLVLRHTMLGDSRILGPIFNRGPIPCGGDQNTVSQAGVRPSSPFSPTHNMANFRAVFDTSDWSASRFVLCGGQSGNPVSDHYDDQFPLWQRGDATPIPWTPDEVLRDTKHSLRLVPEPASGG